MSPEQDSKRDAERFRRLIARIDRVNSEDPNRELVDGIVSSRELIYSRRLTEWVLRLDPQATEALQIAARGQHIARWTIPRERYERNRGGYLRWRETLKAFHIQKISELMREADYPDTMIQRVQTIMGKRQLPSDSETQTLEDALCLVFLQTQFADLKQKTPDDKMREILQKTWKKMSGQGRAAALQLDLSEEAQRWIVQAVSSDAG